ncbi:MAG: hypothetical protein LBM76_01005 [Mycoplasmataceae bacterium]|jgi:hypothetical protein|nr:hypothetical protein [Mycoplasmataceae bacterium]
MSKPFHKLKAHMSNMVDKWKNNSGQRELTNKVVIFCKIYVSFFIAGMIALTIYLFTMTAAPLEAEEGICLICWLVIVGINLILTVLFIFLKITNNFPLFKIQGWFQSLILICAGCIQISSVLLTLQIDMGNGDKVHAWFNIRTWYSLSALLFVLSLALQVASLWISNYSHKVERIEFLKLVSELKHEENSKKAKAKLSKITNVLEEKTKAKV